MPDLKLFTHARIDSGVLVKSGKWAARTVQEYRVLAKLYGYKNTKAFPMNDFRS